MLSLKTEPTISECQINWLRDKNYKRVKRYKDRSHRTSQRDISKRMNNNSILKNNKEKSSHYSGKSL